MGRERERERVREKREREREREGEEREREGEERKDDDLLHSEVAANTVVTDISFLRKKSQSPYIIINFGGLLKISAQNYTSLVAFVHGMSQLFSSAEHKFGNFTKTTSN